MEPNLLRKPKLHFDSAPRPEAVTFDDGKTERRNFPWMTHVVTRWAYEEPDMIRVKIGECMVTIRGHNLGPIFQALEEHTLMRVRAQPGLADQRENERDTFVVEIRFAGPLGGDAESKRSAQIEFDLGK